MGRTVRSVSKRVGSGLHATIVCHLALLPVFAANAQENEERPSPPVMPPSLSEFREALGDARGDPIPRGNPGLWVTTDDYPIEAMRYDQQGTVDFRLNVGTNGEVLSCAIIESSGFDLLDETTCNLIRERASFWPALNEHGDPVASFYTNRVRWVIPSNRETTPSDYKIVYSIVIEPDGHVSSCEVLEIEGAAADFYSAGLCPAPNDPGPQTDTEGNPVRRTYIFNSSLDVTEERVEEL